MLVLDHHLKLNEDTILAPNLCDRFTEADLTRIGACVHDGYTQDKQSRRAWERRNEAGMNLALQVQQAKSFPWPGASNVAFPLVTIGALQFHARAYPAIVQGNTPVKCHVNGEDPTGEVTLRASRVSTHMSWQVMEQDVAWEAQHDVGLFNLSIVGCNFIKTYRDASLGYDVSELVLAKNFILNYWAKSVESCTRKTQLIPLSRNAIYERVKRGTFRDVLDDNWYIQPANPELSKQQQEEDKRQGITRPEPDEQTPFLGLEQHVRLDLDDDGYAEPYIITIDENSRQVLRIVTGFDREADIDRGDKDEIISITSLEYYTKYSFIPSPDGGIYDIGFGVLLGPLNESVNTSLNQIFDAGTMATTAGGFLARGAKLRGGVYTFSPFGWNQVTSTGDDLRKSVFPLPVREPSSVLFQVLSLLIEYTNRISGTTDVMVGENPGQNTPAETSRNMIQQGEKIFNAIFKRVWRAMKQEFRKRYVLNAIYLPERFTFGPTGEAILQKDYRGNPDSISPAADPNLTSDTQRFQQAQAVKASAMQTHGYDLDAVERFYLRALNVEGAEALFPGREKVPAGKDPKVQLQELKNELAMAEMKQEEQQFMLKLMQDEKLNEAQIAKIQGELALQAAAVQGDESDRRINEMNTMLGIMRQRNDEIRAKLDLLMGQAKLALETAGGEAERRNRLEVARIGAQKRKEAA